MCANHNSNVSDSKAKRECTTYKYSNKGNGQLHEAVMLSDRSVFLKCEKGDILYVDQIEETSRIIKPPSAEEYPYDAYEFADMQEVKSFSEKADKADSVKAHYLKKPNALSRNTMIKMLIN